MSEKKPTPAKVKVAKELAEKLLLLRLEYARRLVEKSEKLEQIRKERRGHNLNSHLSKLHISD